MAEAVPVDAATIQALADLKVSEDVKDKKVSKSSSNSFPESTKPHTEKTQPATHRETSSTDLDVEQANPVKPKEASVFQQPSTSSSSTQENYQDTEQKTSTTLLQMVKAGREQDVCRLLDEGVDLNTSDHSGLSPLHWAVRINQEPLVDLLLERGASLEARDQTLRTPLHEAVLIGNEMIVDKLVKKGCDINAQDKDGNNPLHLEAQKTSPVAYSFLDTCCPSTLKTAVRTKNNKGKTPIDISYKSGAFKYAFGVKLDISRLFSEKGPPDFLNAPAPTEPVDLAAMYEEIMFEEIYQCFD